MATFLLMLHAQGPRGPVPIKAGLTTANSELRTASSTTANLRRAVAADSVGQTQWLKGGIIGGLMLGAASAYLVHGFQGLDDFEDSSGEVMFGFVIGAGLGFVIGALIGGQFEK
jgi:hypothetical protein